ncbi:hypothetical protein BSL78_01142 [Apostichopus japonicus]|uniref:Sulfatase-modifying factor enzyme-like domain-containing protein n=1 Tax=Stichopus japonicus TaxID=307972 RepID=A0A2G8LNU6_STIJA|nr:hypothetical protein BSL78_01142 [Apostichopus japonicus]
MYSNTENTMLSFENKKRKISDSMTDLDPVSILTGPYRFRAPKPFDVTNCSKQDILDFFEDSYSLNESLYTVLKVEDAFYMCPDRLRLPLIFYYGHTASVYVNKLLQAEFIQERVNNSFETLFETGVNENKWDNVENNRMGGSFVWPALKEIVKFRRQVRELVREKIFHTELQLPITMDSPWWGLLMVMDHDAVHAETSSVLIRQLPIQFLRIPEGWRRAPLRGAVPVEQNLMIPVKSQTVSIGKPKEFPSYGWNIDYSLLQMRVPQFEASKYLISNREFLEFYDSGGYTNEELWTQEGWQWKTGRELSHPLFWVCTNGCKSGCGGTLESYSHCTPHSDGDANKKSPEPTLQMDGKDKFRLRTLCEEIEMPWDWPVEVNFHEAKAYANWLGEDYRLLTEAEHHAIRDLPPVNLFPPNKLGFHDEMGNVWCWLEDHFNGLPGYQSHFLYDDYARTYFDSKHNMLLGGSWISNGYQASRFVRCWFRRHFYQHAGFRVAKTVDKSQNPPVRFVKPVDDSEDVEIPFYFQDSSRFWWEAENKQFQDETPKRVTLRLTEEYGDATGEGNFYQSLGEFCKQLVDKYKISSHRLLDVGSGCGRFSFEMARQFKEVVGVDLCSNFIGSAFTVRNKGNLDLIRPVIGSALDNNKSLNDTIANIHSEVDFRSIVFKQFSWLPNELNNFDFVLHQLADRVVNKKGTLP